MTTHVIGVMFPEDWQYGSMEHEIVSSTAQQISRQFSSQRNLLINTTWFGPQFENTAWQDLQALFANNEKFDNLFLLATIDPVYISEQQIKEIFERSGATAEFRIGMWEDSQYEWNWHAAATPRYFRTYTIDKMLMKDPSYIFLCYQRKPRRHRVELTNLLIESGLDRCGVLTLGGGSDSDQEVWSEGLVAPRITVENDLSQWAAADIGNKDRFAGLPNDLITLGNLDIWQNHFLNIVSETEFNNWHPRFVTEKTWKPMIGLRPFLIHGQTRIYHWLRKNGFYTFNHYWSHIQVEESEDQHGVVMSVLHWLCDMDKENLFSMYQDMLPLLHHNRERFFEFGKEQYYKMHHLFDSQ